MGLGSAVEAASSASRRAVYWFRPRFAPADSGARRAGLPGAGPRRFFGASCSSAVSSGAAHEFRSGSQRFMAQNQRSGNEATST